MNISPHIFDVVEFARKATINNVNGDISTCLPSWLKTFSDIFDKNEGITLSADAAATLYHTLLIAKLRTEKLIKERDELKNKDV